MYMRLAALVPVAALAAVAAATPNALEARTYASCSTGPIECCNQTFTQGSTALNELLGVLGITIPNVSGLVAYQCNPILGTDSCSQQPVCCTGNTYGGVIIVGCSPATILA